MSESVTIVVVEDDPAIADLLDMYLRQAGYRVIQAPTGERGLQAVKDHLPKLVILDVGLPGDLNGFDVCRTLRNQPHTAELPIMMLTARDDEIDRVLGLELGADDYVTKPFSTREVVARVKGILRRAHGPQPTAAQPVMRFANVEVDFQRRQARVDDTNVALATREFDLLAFLCDNKGLALTRQQLLDGVWGPDWYGDDRTVDVHVRQLRKKLGDALPLDTVWGVGYRLG